MLIVSPLDTTATTVAEIKRCHFVIAI